MWDDITSFKPETIEMGEDGPHKLMPFGLRMRAYPRERFYHWKPNVNHSLSFIRFFLNLCMVFVKCERF